jgi:hypothetical protein
MAMLAQTKAEGEKPFAGSTYETQYKTAYPNYSAPVVPNYVPKEINIPPASSNIPVSSAYDESSLKKIYDALVGTGSLSQSYDEWMKRRIAVAGTSDPTKIVASIRSTISPEFRSVIDSAVGAEKKESAGTGITSGMTTDEIIKALTNWSSSQPDPMAGLKDQIQKLIDAQTKYQSDIASAKTTSGVGPAQEAVTKTTQMLDALEENINQRISGTGMLESQRQRQYAVEQKPLAKTLGTQTNALQLAQQNYQDLVSQAGVPLEMQQNLLPIYQTMANYQTPQQKLTDMIAQESLLKTLGLGDYAKTTETPTQITEVNGRKLLVNTQTGQTIADLGAITPSSSSANTPTSYDEWVLAGGEAETGKTYAKWLAEGNVKPATVAQQTVAGYANRLEQAEPTLKNLEKAITSMNFAIFEAQLKMPSALQTAEIQQYMQAGRNLINAILRRESGAVISPSEFSEARAQYLPQPGDKPETLAQKEANRKMVLQGYINSSGSAYTPMGEMPQFSSSPLSELEDDINKLAESYHREWGREQLIEDLYAEYKNDLTKQQIIDKVYAITKQMWGN